MAAASRPLPLASTKSASDEGRLRTPEPSLAELLDHLSRELALEYIALMEVAAEEATMAAGKS